MVSRVSDVKNYKFSVKTLYRDSELYGYVKRVSRKNNLYVYIYERGLLGDILLIALKVTVYERE